MLVCLHILSTGSENNVSWFSVELFEGVWAIQINNRLIFNWNIKSEDLSTNLYE